MDSPPGSNLVDLLPFPNSSSDISCSSGPQSVVSTRETSPASSTHRPLAEPPSGSTTFQDLSNPTSSNLQKEPEMDRDTFRTVNSRQGRLTGDLSRASHAPSGITASSGASSFGLLQQTTGRPLAPNPLLQAPTSLSPPLTAPRGLYCRDWRTSTASFDSLIFPSTTSTSSAGASSSSPSASRGTNTYNNILSSPVSPVGFGNHLSNRNGLPSSDGYLSIANLADDLHPASHDPRTFRNKNNNNNNNHQHQHQQLLDANTGNNTAAANMHPTKSFLITEADLDKAMGYCYDRGDGQYTRLVAVDLLPVNLRYIPRRVASDEGLIILPIPCMSGINGQPSDYQLEPQAAVTPPPSSPSDHPSTDLIQNRIDSIVASSPQGTSSPANAGTTTGPGAIVLVTRSRDNSSAVGAVSANNNNHTRGHTHGAPNKRDKIYCDKWIHDGTCAFTQQGCKFKHEMPNDRETQEMLGLFHGFPGWWKKLLAEQQRSPSSAGGGGALEDSPVGVDVGVGVGRAIGAGPGAGIVGPSYANNVWRAVAQNAPGHTGEGVEDVRPASFGSGGAARGSGGAFGTRGGSRRGGAPFNAPNYGPIGPPSRLGRAPNRANRGPSMSLNGFGSPRARGTNSSEANLYVALMDRAQGRGDGDGRGDDDVNTDGEEHENKHEHKEEEEEEQRGAKL